MLPLGTKAPQFTLPNTNPLAGIQPSHSLIDSQQDMLLIIFMCNHCPYVVHILEGLSSCVRDLQAKYSFDCLAISSNNVATHPQDSPAKMAELAKAYNFSFPYLYDESQEVAKSYQAACTPDLFVFGEDKQLIYRGQLDDSRPGSSIPVTGESLIEAVKTYAQKGEILGKQYPSQGCSIKWK